MSNKVRISSNVNIEDISIHVASCPGCGHQHDLKVTRPDTTRNCSYQKGSFHIKITPVLLKPKLDISIKFYTSYGQETDISQQVRVQVGGVDV